MSGILQGVLASIGGAPATYIEDVFSTYLYTGNGSTNNIDNQIDFTKGGLIWIKNRGSAQNHVLTDTVRGDDNYLSSNTTAVNTSGGGIYLGTGFAAITSSALTNASNNTYCSWSFREQAKFFDVVTYTGNGVANRLISHSLDSVPGMIIIKRTDASGYDWMVYHRSIGASNALFLNTTDASFASGSWDNTTPTSTSFDVSNNSYVNANGGTYVAYLFAHNAGGFGLTGTDNVISCGSYTGNGSSQTITLGYEPQFLLIKNATTGATNWLLLDVMRGMPVSGTSKVLYPNTSDAEANWPQISPTATGFTLRNGDGWLNGNGDTYIYMAIRRGPMRTPTLGTSVFAPYVTNTVAASASGSTSTSSLYRSDFVTDFVIQTRKAFADSKYAVSRLTGNQFLTTNTTDAESTSTVPWDSNIAALNFSSNYGQWMFRRSPGFFDIVCYTGNNGVATTQTHNLGVAPELMFIKGRDIAEGWQVYVSSLGNTKYLQLNSDAGEATATNRWNSTSPTSTVFSLGTSSSVNWSTNTYVAYLFATVAGVSKVGSYTGTGSTQTINAGLPTGARFVMIKRTDSTSDWRVWDSARGMVSGTSNGIPYNTTAAETNSNDIYTTTNGFQLANGDGSINGSGGSYIYLAIA